MKYPSSCDDLTAARVHTLYERVSFTQYPETAGGRPHEILSTEVRMVAAKHSIGGLPGVSQSDDVPIPFANWGFSSVY